VPKKVKAEQGKFGGGRQPRIHPITTPIREKIIRCPVCDQVFVALVEVQPAAFKLPEAAHYLGNISLPTLRRLIARGLIRPVRALRHLTISRAECARYLQDNTSP